MSNLSKSPERGTFQIKSYEEKLQKDPCDETALSIVALHKKWKEESNLQELDPEWQKHNLEYDLRSTEWILKKVRESKTYAQNLYAAMCNRDFVKHEVIPILKKETWSCSWRYAGGIIADMRQEGDYIDWYCSGITEEKEDPRGHVHEGYVTEEIKNDLFQLGWIVLDEE